MLFLSYKSNSHCQQYSQWQQQALLQTLEYKPECTDKKLGPDLDQKLIMLIGQ